MTGVHLFLPYSYILSQQSLLYSIYCWRMYALCTEKNLHSFFPAQSSKRMLTGMHDTTFNCWRKLELCSVKYVQQTSDTHQSDEKCLFRSSILEEETSNDYHILHYEVCCWACGRTWPKSSTLCIPSPTQHKASAK